MHFTYQTPDLSSLKQGDVLKKTPELADLIREVHPHYGQESYLYFQVLTQTCDLVRRGAKPCKSRYITLAAVRSLDLVVSREISEFEDHVEFDGKLLCSTKHKLQLADILNKLLNNNDPRHFYLAAEPTLGFMSDCCTQLPLSISIRAHQHYDVCLAAKVLELQENFRAKLGWLVGNLFSRVGTEDYVPGKAPSKKAFETEVEERMKQFVAWVGKEQFSDFKQRLEAGRTVEEIVEQAKEAQKKERERKLELLVASLTKSLKFDETQQTKLRNILSQNPIVAKGLSA